MLPFLSIVNRSLSLPCFLTRTLSPTSVCFHFLFPEFDVTLGKTQILVSGPSAMRGWKEFLILATSAAHRCPKPLLYHSGEWPLRGQKSERKWESLFPNHNSLSWSTGLCLCPECQSTCITLGAAALRFWEPRSVNRALKMPFWPSIWSIFTVFTRCFKMIASPQGWFRLNSRIYWENPAYIHPEQELSIMNALKGLDLS